MELEIYEYLDVRERLIILDGVKDALIPHFSGKKIAHEMWMALFQGKLVSIRTTSPTKMGSYLRNKQ